MRPRRIPTAARPARFTDSDIKKLEPLYITDDWKLMRVERLGPDTMVADLVENFDPKTMDPVKYKNECEKYKAVLEDRRKYYGMLYYKPYRAMAVEHVTDRNGRHMAKRVIVPGKNPNPAIPPALQEDCYGWTDRYPQEEFHKSKKRVRLLLASNKVGKTYGAIEESLQLTFGTHPYTKMPVPNRGRIVGTDLEKGIEEDVWGIYKILMPASELSSEPRKYSGGQVKKVCYKNGSTVEFMSYEQDDGLFEGGEGNWCLFNEPPPRKVFVATVRWLMKRGGIIFIAATPLWEAWLYDELFLKQGPNPDQPDVFQINAYENPYLSDEGIKSLVDATPEDEQEARIFGAFKHLTGLVYKEFGNVHRIPAFPIPKDWTRGMVHDYHSRTPCALLWYAVDPSGNIYLYDELKVDKTIFEIAELIKMKEKLEYGRPVPTRRIDNIAATPDRNTKKSPMREFRDAGEKLKWPLAFRTTTKNHSAGYDAVHSYLKVKNGKPGIYFLEENVPNTIASMLHFQWADMSGEKEKTLDSIHAHFADDVRYVCIEKPTYRRDLPAGFQEQSNEGVDDVTGYRS